MGPSRIVERYTKGRDLANRRLCRPFGASQFERRSRPSEPGNELRGSGGDDFRTLRLRTVEGNTMRARPSAHVRQEPL